MSAATAQLVAGYFVRQPRGTQALKGLATPVDVYEVRTPAGRRPGWTLSRRATRPAGGSG